ncbi:MAG: hypothetical protein ACYC2H_11395 [Thermoplasmatota archaeon]
MLPPRPVLAAALLLVGGLAWSLGNAPPVVADLATAARWEGQTVALVGWATELRHDVDATRFLLVDGTHLIAVRVADADADVVPGDRVRAEGRLTRWLGDLRLDVEDAGRLRIVPGPDATSPTWDELAARPEDWTGRPLLLRGTVDGDHLRDGGRSVALGEGPWPTEGPVRVRGFLRDDPACLCHRLDAREVWPWTP